MNRTEERVYTRTDDAAYKAAELMSLLETIRHDPVGAEPDDMELMKEINGLLNQALERAKTVESHTGKG